MGKFFSKKTQAQPRGTGNQIGVSKLIINAQPVQPSPVGVLPGKRGLGKEMAVITHQEKPAFYSPTLRANSVSPFPASGLHR